METQPVPSPLRKSPPWIMKSLMTRWNSTSLYPCGKPPFLCSPVQNCRKFSHVLGATSANSSILILPTSAPPMVTSKNTTGLFGLGARWCHCISVILECATPRFGPAPASDPSPATLSWKKAFFFPAWTKSRQARFVTSQSDGATRERGVRGHDVARIVGRRAHRDSRHRGIASSRGPRVQHLPRWKGRFRRRVLVCDPLGRRRGRPGRQAVVHSRGGPCPRRVQGRVAGP
mmetsp:Transcript_7574/g.33414  ORF Transcript_7574/g.33414 Transcript_7574/m.33414 type:complete len:231 (+) Transcript_7574:3288-3980(+)